MALISTIPSHDTKFFLQRQDSIIPSFERDSLHSIDAIASDRFDELISQLQLLKDFANPELCEVQYLPFLAHAFKLDFWDNNLKDEENTLSEEEKRALIKQSLLLHKHKGTIYSLEKVFEILDMDARIKEWFDYEGDPYHFKIELFFKDRQITPERIEQLLKYIDIYKSARSVLDELSLGYMQKQKIKTLSGCVGEVSSYAIQI